MTDKTGVVVYFPVAPHVHKFLQAKCGVKMVASKQGLYGNVILDLFSKRGANAVKMPETLTFPVEISMRYMRENGIFIDEQVVFKFNNRIDAMLREEMRTYVNLTNSNNSVPKDTAIRQFMDSYKITEEDIKFETLKKDFHRNKH